MAPGKKPATDESGWRPPGDATIADRIAAFTMLDAMKDASQAQKCLRLALIGFTNAEIAEMLQTTTGNVAQSLYSERKKPRTSIRSVKA
jgi:DNA-directed RNA polymerase specialized sigma24 family protein